MKRTNGSWEGVRKIEKEVGRDKERIEQLRTYIMYKLDILSIMPCPTLRIL